MAYQPENFIIIIIIIIIGVDKLSFLILKITLRWSK